MYRAKTNKLDASTRKSTERQMTTAIAILGRTAVEGEPIKELNPIIGAISLFLTAWIHCVFKPFTLSLRHITSFFYEGPITKPNRHISFLYDLFEKG